ncbi:MAG: helix-turn-helix transcriptional regulator [Alphaproteobacteria bacterium]|nr:helix-turn-helix transcriptional regulator [Alphaproteobacteria bacterium]
MTKSRATLTELEGAILGVLIRAQSATAYRVRQVFQASRSAEWSGSAGAVYPAMRRLASDGLIKARAQEDGRGTQTYTLTAAGRAAHDAWLCDIDRAVGPGLDPFRTRAPLWPTLPPAARRKLMKALKAEIESRRATLARERDNGDEGDAIAARLHIALLDTRLKWLADLPD